MCIQDNRIDPTDRCHRGDNNTNGVSAKLCLSSNLLFALKSGTIASAVIAWLNTRAAHTARTCTEMFRVITPSKKCKVPKYTSRWYGLEMIAFSSVCECKLSEAKLINPFFAPGRKTNDWWLWQVKQHLPRNGHFHSQVVSQTMRQWQTQYYTQYNRRIPLPPTRTMQNCCQYWTETCLNEGESWHKYLWNLANIKRPDNPGDVMQGRIRKFDKSPVGLLIPMSSN